MLVSGRFSPELSNIGDLPDGVFLSSTAEALKARPELVQGAFDASDETGVQPFASLNAVFFADGFVLALETGVVLEIPVEIIHFGNSQGAFHLRNIIHAGAGSSAAIIETAAGASWLDELRDRRQYWRCCHDPARQNPGRG